MENNCIIAHNTKYCEVDSNAPTTGWADFMWSMAAILVICAALMVIFKHSK